MLVLITCPLFFDRCEEEKLPSNTVENSPVVMDTNEADGNEVSNKDTRRETVCPISESRIKLVYPYQFIGLLIGQLI